MGNSKVIGEFVCDSVDKYESEFWDDTPDYMDENHAMEQIRRSFVAEPDDWECEEEFEYITGYEVVSPDDCELCKQSCLTYAEIRKYIGIGDKIFYGWHISDLKIYDKPKELSEFYRKLPEKILESGDYDCRKGEAICIDYPEGGDCCEDCIFGGRVQITRPPQSWCYVEEL